MTFGPFKTYIALKEESFVSSEEVVAEFLKSYPKFSISSVKNSEKGEAILLTVGNVPISIMQFTFPVPEDILTRALAGNRSWSKAKSVLRYHQAHLMVSVLASAEDFLDASAFARCTSVLSAILCRLTPALAVYWMAGDILSDVQSFMETEANTVKGDPPVDHWLQFMFAEKFQNKSDTPIRIGVTKGLHPFIGRELEFQSEKISKKEIMRVLQDMAYMCLRKGPCVSDGDVFSDGRHDFHARFVDQGYQEGIPAIQLSV